MPNIKPAQVDYLYRGAQGQPIRIMRRVQTEEGKKFYPVDPATGKKTTWDITKGDPGRVPYRLPEFLKAQASGAPIIIVEGEKCVDALAALGWLGVTTTPFGSNGFKGAALESLLKPYISTESSYIIIPDCDKPGRKYAYNMAEALTRLGCHAATLDLNKDRYDGYDIADWIDDQTGKYSNAEKLELFLGLLDLAEPFELPPVKESASPIINPDTGLTAGIKALIDHAKNYGVIYNGFLESLVIKNGLGYRRLKDKDLNTLYHRIPYSEFEEVKRSKRSKDYFATFLESDFMDSMNPVDDFIAGLRWDGVNHIGELAAYLATDYPNELIESILAHWLAGAIANMLNPHYTPQGMLILTGVQGIGKSTFLRHLCPPQLRDYYSENLPDLHNKDSLATLAENVIINVSELASFQKSDYNTLKGFLTLSSVKYRPAYGRYAMSMPRRASFCGDTNDDRFLTDPTGNRRFWVIRANSIQDVPSYCGDQVWAQALAQRDEILDDNRNFIGAMNNHAEEFYQEPDIAMAFHDVFFKPESDDLGIEYLSATEIFAEITNGRTGIKGSAVGLGRELKRLKFEQNRSGAKRQWIVKRHNPSTNQDSIDNGWCDR